jgi:hypothetical protein
VELKLVVLVWPQKENLFSVSAVTGAQLRAMPTEKLQIGILEFLSR